VVSRLEGDFKTAVVRAAGIPKAGKAEAVAVLESEVVLGVVGVLETVVGLGRGLAGVTRVLLLPETTELERVSGVHN
jgi:hypothetical protein